MNFEYSQEQITLQDSLKKYLEKNYTFSKHQILSESCEAFSPEAWQFYAEIGLLGIAFEEQYGGLEGSNADQILIMETLGRFLCLEPYLSTVILCGTLINLTASHAQKTQWIPNISDGSLKLSLAHFEPDARYNAHRVSVRATLDGESHESQYILNGHKNVVLNGHAANAFLVSARTQGADHEAHGISLFWIQANTPGLILSPYRTQDGSMACDLEFKNLTVQASLMIGQPGLALSAITQALEHANAALCAEALGIMTVINELTLDYLKTRQQFGKNIGSFQALQHRMVDMLGQEQQSRSMAILAAQALSLHDSKKRARDVSAAKAFICKAARHVGQEAIQLHGGIGVAHEYSVAHYFKRLTMITLLLGDYNHHLKQVSDYLIDK